MKKILVSLISLLLVQQVFAATPAATGSATSQINDLKDRLATKVAELRQSQKKAISGTIKATSISTITVETKTSDVKIELTDSIKVFQTIKGKRTALTTDDIEKGDSVVVFGDYDTGLDLLKAKVVIIQSILPERIAGIITKIDKTEFTITLDIGNDKTYIVDIEKTTSVFGFDKQTGVVKGGFSKLEAGSFAVVIGNPVPKKENQISAIRFLDLGNLSGLTPTPTPTTEASPSATLKP